MCTCKGEGERRWCGGHSRMNERQQEKDHKRASHRISHPEAGRANRLGPKCQNSASVERVASASIFSNFLEDFQEDTPAKIPLCDAERMLESGGKQRIGDFPLCSEKLRQGKVATLAKKKRRRRRFPVHNNTGSKCKCREEIWIEAEMWRRETDTYFVILSQIAIITNIHPLHPEHSYISSELVVLLPASPLTVSLGLHKGTAKEKGGEVEGKEEEEMRSTQNNSGKSCCVVATVQVDLWLSCFKYKAADLTQLHSAGEAMSHTTWWHWKIHPCYFVTSCDFIVITDTGQQRQRMTGAVWTTKGPPITLVSTLRSLSQLQHITACDATQDGQKAYLQ